MTTSNCSLLIANCSLIIAFGSSGLVVGVGLAHIIYTAGRVRTTTVGCSQSSLSHDSTGGLAEAAATIAVRLLCRADDGGSSRGSGCTCGYSGRCSTHSVACATEDEGLGHTAGCGSRTRADAAGDEPRGDFGHETEDVGAHEHAHGVHTVGADALQAKRTDLLP